MDDRIELRGNLCSCGEMWFGLNMPESDPSFCPFCGKKISIGGVSDLRESEDYDLNEETKNLMAQMETMKDDES